MNRTNVLYKTSDHTIVDFKDTLVLAEKALTEHYLLKDENEPQDILMTQIFLPVDFDKRHLIGKKINPAKNVLI